LPSRGQVRLSAVWAALDTCLPGYRRVERTHHWWVYSPDGKATYRGIPKGAHSGRKTAEVQSGHIKTMARVLGILDCMKGEIKGL